MSFAAFRAVTEARTNGRLRGGTVLAVGLAMAEHTNQRGELRAGVRRLGEWSGVAKSATARHVAAMVAAGVYERTESTAGRRAARYRLVSPVGDGQPVDKSGLVSPVGDAIVSPGSRETALVVSPCANLSYIDPVYKPRVVSHDMHVTAPAEIPDHVDVLRQRLSDFSDRVNGSKP